MKPTILEFVGGAWDGRKLSAASPDSVEATLAAYALRMTDNGRRDQAVNMPGEHAPGFSGSTYVVTDRTVGNREVVVRLVHHDNGDADVIEMPCQTIRFHFVGGCLDGIVLASDAENIDEAMLVASYYCLTHSGQLSTLVKVPRHLCRRICPTAAPDGATAHYRVAVRKELEGEVTVTLQYLTTGD
jgi:hypothetical protein